MKVMYVKEDDKPSFFKRLLRIIKVQDNKIIIQPIQDNYNSKYIKRVVKRIQKICKKKNVANIVLSKKLKTNKELVSQIDENSIHIFDGKWLFNYMAFEAIDFALQEKKIKKETTEVSILTKNITQYAIETIKILAKEYKRVNVVTNNISQFKYLESKIYNEYGIMITITNNKRKSLLNSRVILNFDFPKELLNKYSIFDEAIVLNVQGNMELTRKRFNGCVFNDYEIFSTRMYDFFDMCLINEFWVKDLFEAEIYRRDSFYNIRQDIVRGQFKIKKLYHKIH